MSQATSQARSSRPQGSPLVELVRDLCAATPLAIFLRALTAAR